MEKTISSLVAQFTKKDGTDVEIHLIKGQYTAFEGERMVQQNMTSNDTIRYLANRLHGR